MTAKTVRGAAQPLERLLLVELAAVDRFHRAISYPYLLGFARELGVEARWVRLGVKASRQHERGESGVGLYDDEAESIRRVIGELEPTWIVLDRQPSASMLAVLEEAACGARIGLLDSPTSGRDDLETIPAEPGGWRNWLRLRGEAEDQRRFFEVEPSFELEPLNEAARSMQPLPFLVFGEECTYFRPLSRSPLYAGLDLSGCVHQGGCSFCNTTRGRSQKPYSPKMAREHLSALLETLPPHEGRLEIRLQGELPLRNIEDIARACREIGARGADLLLDARADSLTRSRGALEAACATLAGSDVKIQIALVGVESFSRDALERFNKGLSPLDNFDAVATMLELERDHPRTFGFREHGGISLILFDPWTSLEELALNLRLLQECGLEPLSGKVLGGRLRLEEGLPITELARREGLITQEVTDEALETAKRNLYDEELPWRFKNAGVEPICRVLLRLGDPGDLDEKDPLTRRAHDLLREGKEGGLGPLDLAVRIVDDALFGDGSVMCEREARHALPSDARKGREDLGPAAILKRAHERNALAGTARFAADEPVYDAPYEATAFLAALCHEGLKPVAKIELLPRKVALETIARHSLPNPRMREASAEGDLVELFFGRREEDVERAVEMTRRAMAGSSNKEYVEALREIGLLLGYPRCCVERWALGESAKMRESYVWPHLARRIETPGKVSPYMNPWYGLFSDQYIPCRLDCEATLALLPRARDVVSKIISTGNLENNEARMRNPWLVLLRGQCSALELLPEETPSERFRFRAGEAVWSEEAPELRAAAEGDELVMESERLLVLRGGREAADLSVRAFVWWHERAFQTSLWSRVITLRELTAEAAPRDRPAWTPHGQNTDHEASRGRPDVDPDSLEEDALAPGPRLAELKGKLEHILARSRIDDFGLWVRSRDALALRLGSGDAAVLLHVREASDEARSFFTAEPFAVSIPKDRPLDTPSKRSRVDALSRALKAAGRHLHR